MKVEFLPNPEMLTAIAKEIKSSHRAFPLFGTAKLFLSRQERHRVRLTTQDETAPLYQVGDGCISLDRSIVEREAFKNLKDKYYREEVQQNEPPKGNFTNVARLRGGGLMLGPTNYHGYQPALRRVFEERFSRRMSFAEFQHREIEIVTEEQAVNDWKEQARSVVTFVTTQEAEPLTFKSLAEVEAHFRGKYLPTEVKSGKTFEAAGPQVRATSDRSLSAALREAFDREMAFPAAMVNCLRPELSRAGLHFFKHRKRVVYATSVRPVRYPMGQPARDNVVAILRTVEANPRITKHDLAVKILGQHFEAPEKLEEKTALAADLHYLLIAGHVIEFADGRLDVPLPPKGEQGGKPGAETEADGEAETADAHDGPEVTEPAAETVEATPTAEAPVVNPVAEVAEIAEPPAEPVVEAVAPEPAAEVVVEEPAPAIEANPVASTEPTSAPAEVQESAPAH